MKYKAALWIGQGVLLSVIPFASCLAEAGGVKSIGVAVEGVNHLGPNHSISPFYIDKSAFGNVNRGGGSGTICCVTIPEKWRPGLVVEVRWGVANWSNEIREEIKIGNYRSVVDEGVYKAIVPIEEYEEPMNLFVHFFPGGKIRVLTSQYSQNSEKHPVVKGDDNAATMATKGVKIRKIFSEKELRDLIEYNKERMRKFKG
ncbi:DUF3304 domain-containing protein [Pseudoduganella namucuonensis]|uniref:DUF3304 domain-containing protein n=1 Tax=Pseudoduganella namucuonensis TaxID=1035707 RepID=UPI0015A5306A|nr:DUF3304 domain-containing protein [Pseudoduganella namucuonensis]